MLWEQNEKLEQQNKQIAQEARLREEQIASERRNAKLIAEATVEAEIVRADSERNMELLREAHEMNLELLKQEHKNRLRCQKLCDKLDIDYDELEEFNQYIRYSKYSLEEIMKLEKQISESKEHLKEYKSDDYIENLIDEKESKSNDDSIGYFIIDSEIRRYNNKIQEIENVKFTYFQAIVDFPLLLWLGYEAMVLFTCGDDFDLFMLALVIFTIFNLVCKLDLKIRKTNLLKEYNNEIDELKQEKNKRENWASKMQKTKIKNTSKEIQENEKKLKEFENLNTVSMQIIYDDFLKFRLAHYNSDIENLFKKIKLGNIIQMDKRYESNNKKIEEEITNKGTVKDYINYIRQILN